MPIGQDIIKMDTYKLQKLENGLTIIYQNNISSSSINFHIGIVAGSRYERVGEYGLSHLVEHLISRKVTESLRTNLWQESYVLSTFDAFTNKDFTKYYFEVNKSDLKIAINIINQLFAPEIDEISLKHEKSIVLREIAEDLYNQEEIFSDKMAEILFNGSSLAHRILGDEKTLKNITKSQVDNFLSCYYKPDNIVVVISGNFDEIELIKSFKKVAKPNIKDTVQSSSNLSIVAEAGINYLPIDIDGEQVFVNLSFIGLRESVVDSYRNTFFANLLYEYLLYHIRDIGFSYSFTTSIIKFKGLSVLEISAVVSRDIVEVYISELRHYIVKFRNEIAPAALNFAKNNSIKMLNLDIDDPRALTDYLLGTYLLFGRPISIPEIADIISTIKPSDVDMFYKNYFSYDGNLFISKKEN